MMYVDVSETSDVSKACRQPIFAAAAQIDWDILGVGTESFGVSEYLIFDLKCTSLSSKAPLLYG
jgi:hypothetical protein